jgi:Mrp family chromosome partitioning ATPase
MSPTNEEPFMSRNFELMTQLEIEGGGMGDHSAPVMDNHAAEILSRQGSDAGGEEMLRLIQRIFLSGNGGAPRQVVFCGVDSENESSSVCGRAGRTLAANSSRPVCLVDANLRSPRLSKMFEVVWAADPPASYDSIREQCVNIEGNLWLAGPNILAHKSRILLPPDELRTRLEQLRDTFEYMLIDAPGTSVCGDAQLLGQVADAAILVIEASSTRRMTARRAKENLEAGGVRLLGTVLNNRSFPIPESLYKRL